MPNENNTAFILAENEAPEMLSYIMYSLLNDENKQIIDRLIERLITEQSSNQQ